MHSQDHPEGERLIVRRARPEDVRFADVISAETAASALARGTGIARRPPEMIRAKILDGKAVVAFTASGQWAGFTYLETWEGGRFVSNSGLIVAPAFRKLGVAARLKQLLFRLSRQRFPRAKICSITTGAAVMKLNTRLGFEPVTYAAITQDPAFWKGCESCPHHHILQAQNGSRCLCTALLFEPGNFSTEFNVKVSEPLTNEG